MTLQALTDYICGKVNLTEAEDKAACKGYLQARFLMIWDLALWKDSLVEYVQTLSPTGYLPTSNWLPSHSTLLLPPIFSRVIAARTSARRLNVQRPEFYYRADPDAFTQTGEATEFFVMPAAVWEFDTARDIYAIRELASDQDSVFKADLLDADGAGVTRVNTKLASSHVFLGNTARIDSVLKNASNGFVKLGGVSDLVTIVNNGDKALDVFFKTDVGPGLLAASNLAAGSSTVALRESLSKVYVTTVGNSTPLLTTTAIPGGADFTGTITISFISKDDGYSFAFATASGDTYVTINAAETGAKKRQRLRLVGIPKASTTIRVLGKRSAPTFSDDLDEPGLTGVDNCLIAFALADMLERARQYGKSAGKMQEGLTLLEQLKDVETAQQSHHMQITPDYGYGDEDRAGWTNSKTESQPADLQSQARGMVTLPNASDAGTVSGLNLSWTPTGGVLTIIKPSAGLNLSASLVKDSISSNGFSYTLTGLTDSGQYQMVYILF